MPAPLGSLVLFQGGSGLSEWTARGGGPPGWKVDRDSLVVVPGAGDLVSKRSFTNFQLHLEFWLPPSDPHASEPSTGGVYLQGRYELQLMDSAGAAASDHVCGALSGQRPPLLNAGRPAGVWQAMEVAFRGPVLDTNGFPAQPARLTVFLNGLLVHDNVPLHGPTEGAFDPYEACGGPMVLQDHGAPLRFRNVWVVQEPYP